jgi:hypothetical protein
VLPKLEKAVSALDMLTRTQVAELRTVSVETVSMGYIARSLWVIFDEPLPKRTGTRVDDYWEPARVLLSDPPFLAREGVDGREQGQAEG